jgi:hypothetical protein
MIQRKQTLFLLQLVFLSIALLFIPSNYVQTAAAETDVTLVPVKDPVLHSNIFHATAIAANFLVLILSFITIFIWSKRETQLRLTYVLTGLWVLITLLILFCAFVDKDEPVTAIRTNYFAVAIAVFGIAGGMLAARFIKKDIALLKSVDRIR